MQTKTKNRILIVLVLLPCLLPYIHIRGYYSLLFGLTDNTPDLVTSLEVIFFWLMPFYWIIVGYCFACFYSGGFKCGLLLGNLPLFFNLLGQIIYYDLFSIEGNSHLWFEYLISSHLDKGNCFQDAFESGAVSAAFTAAFLMGAFTIGYLIGEKMVKGRITINMTYLEKLKEKQLLKTLFLVFLVLLPFCFPFTGIRGDYLIPAGRDPFNLDQYILLFLLYGLAAMPYWFFLGRLFRFLGIGFKTSFFLGNLPIFFNMIGQFIYYVLLGITGNPHPWFEYLISSHIDKFDIIGVLFRCPSYTVQIICASGFFLVIFAAGYLIENREIKDRLAEQQGESEPQDTQMK